MKQKFKGIADITIKNIETGEVKTYTEYNRLTPLLEELFDNSIFDGCVSYNRQLINYASKLVLLNGDFNEYSTLIPDNCELLDVIEASTINDYIDQEYEGYEYIFNLGTDITGTFNTVSLAPDTFKNFQRTALETSNELVSGNTEYNALGEGETANYGEVVKLDIDNSMYWALQFNENYIYINQIQHDFNAVQLFTIAEASSSKLISSTAIDLTEFRTEAPNAKLSFAVDHINNNLIIFYIYSGTRQYLNTYIIDLDDLATTEVHKMTIPNEILLDINPYGEMAFSIYKGKLIFSCSYTVDGVTTYQIVGIDYLDSTNYIIYEVNLSNSLIMRHNPGILFPENETLISNHIVLKNDTAYIIPNIFYSLYFYDKSKIINIDPSNWVNVYLSPLSVTTVNKLSKPIIKTAAEQIKIKYRIVKTREA